MDLPVEPEGRSQSCMIQDAMGHEGNILTDKDIESSWIETSDGSISSNWLSALLAVHFVVMVLYVDSERCAVCGTTS